MGKTTLAHKLLSEWAGKEFSPHQVGTLSASTVGVAWAQPQSLCELVSAGRPGFGVSSPR